ncbi:MAG: hypothetical protein MK211_04415 [Flavobacteriales bacterium]|jgi:bacteriorhodopsin|uniref:hypothetical protein n=1 Tax=Candidatus Ulvibacter alkanivorans TaxID=2267620 RepID=UPI001FE51F75|nr:hypothetical protein [Candidatus Ulvibacter alkanivorans]MCH2489372.1 hypothetical protein [Flavobacteriales bacterium]
MLNLKAKQLMKLSGVSLLYITTFLLITVVIFVWMDLGFNWVFYTICIGQLVLVVTVIQILKDDYTTTKTFEDFYEDHPIGNIKNQ